VLKSLRILCFWCSRPRRGAGPAADGTDCFAAEYSRHRGARRCSHCDGPQPNYHRDGNGIGMEWPAGSADGLNETETAMVRQPFTSQTAHDILRACSDSDWGSLGFSGGSRPETMVPCALVVPPPVVRPAMVNDARQRGQDDLTSILQCINKKAIALRAAIAADDGEAVEEHWAALQADVCALYNNTSRAKGQTLQRNGAPTRTLKHRLTGKQGRLRENMMGKRTNQSARSVISPDPTLDLDEVGVPERIATLLTVPEPVNHENLSRLTARVQAGTGVLHGAATVITCEGCVIDLEACDAERRRNLRLRPATVGRRGDVVERYLTDGSRPNETADIVVFNRQPSLHKFSMMAHRVRVLPGLTFRLSECAAKPYNADFDGDEMNLHVPQSAVARAEASELMCISRLLSTPQGNRPVLGLVQDSLLGAYLLSDPATALSRPSALDILHHIRRAGTYQLPPGDMHATVSGRQIISVLLPRDLTVQRKALRIVDGVLLHGRLDKSTIGTGGGSIIHILSQDYGSERAARFVSDIQSVTMRFLALRGFTIGIGDCIIPEAQRHAVREAVDNSAAAAQAIVSDGESFRTVGMGAEAEAATVRVASAALPRVGQAVSSALGDDNSLCCMIAAGSKGNAVNYTQICGCIGQNCVEGGRIGVAQRTLPCFLPNDSSLEAHGFVRRCYIEGLQPAELFFHAQGGREGLVDTAVKTAETGYLQRRAIKGMEEKAIGHVPHSAKAAPRPVLSAGVGVIQMNYGGDGCDASRLERVELPALLDPPAARAAWAGCDGDAEALEDAHRSLLSGREALIGVGIQTHDHLPVSIERLVHTYRGGGVKDGWAGCPPGEAVPQLCDAVCRLMGGPGTCPGLLYCIRYWLSAAALRRAGVPPTALPSICCEVKRRVARAVVAPGEMVGVITAQMIGEPLTQMTLNTFHLAGTHSGGQTQGIKRIKELVDVTKNPSTPIITLSLRGRAGDSLEFMQYYGERLVSRCIGDICLPSSVRVAGDSSAEMRTSLRLARLCSDHEVADDAPRLVIPFDVGAMRDLSMQPADVIPLVRAVVNPFGIAGYDSTEMAIVLRAEMTEPHLLTELLTRLGEKLRAVAVQGVDKVRDVQTRRVGGSALGGAVADRLVLQLHGGRLDDVMHLPCVDWHSITSTNVTDVLDSFGIEAARSVLLRELTITMSYDGTYVNLRHLQLLVDSMCYRGYVMPMSRHGINRGGSGETFKKCSYEETMEVLAQAALYGDGDNMQGITPSVALGQSCPIMGTASCRAFFDTRTAAPLSAQRRADNPARAKRALGKSHVTRGTTQHTSAVRSGAGDKRAPLRLAAAARPERDRAQPVRLPNPKRTRWQHNYRPPSPQTEIRPSNTNER